MSQVTNLAFFRARRGQSEADTGKGSGNNPSRTRMAQDRRIRVTRYPDIRFSAR